MNHMGIVILSFLFSFIFGCGEPSSKISTATRKKQESKISALLTEAQINLSNIDNTLQYDAELVKLDKNLKGFSGSTRITLRKRGILLEDNKILTTLTVHTKIDYTSRTYVLPKDPVYIILFDGDRKEVISATLLGPYLSVISLIPDSLNSFNISALLRQVNGENFTSKVKSFTVTLKEDTLVVEK